MLVKKKKKTSFKKAWFTYDCKLLDVTLEEQRGCINKWEEIFFKKDYII